MLYAAHCSPIKKATSHTEGYTGACTSVHPYMWGDGMYIKNKPRRESGFLEVPSGIEPLYTVLQTVA